MTSGESSRITSMAWFPSDFPCTFGSHCVRMAHCTRVACISECTAGGKGRAGRVTTAAHAKSNRPSSLWMCSCMTAHLHARLPACPPARLPASLPARPPASRPACLPAPGQCLPRCAAACPSQAPPQGRLPGWRERGKKETEERGEERVYDKGEKKTRALSYRVLNREPILLTVEVVYGEHNRRHLHEGSKHGRHMQ